MSLYWIIILAVVFLFLTFVFYRFSFRRGYVLGATHVLDDWKRHMGIGEFDEELPDNVVRMTEYRHNRYDYE